MSSKSKKKTSKKSTVKKTTQTPPVNKLGTSESEVTLALSDLHLRRDHLEQERQWLIKQITRKQKELSNFVEQMREIATQIFQGSQPHLEKIVQLSQEVHQFFEEIFSGRKISKKNQRKIHDIYQFLIEYGIVIPAEDDETDNELDELFEEEFESEDENEEGNYRAYKPSENPEPAFEKKEEIRHIRQTFLRLAEVFHPDKVTDEETKTRHTEIMKELNKAYRAKDFAKLLELEKHHLENQKIDGEKEDDMSRHCRLLEQENQLLRQQYDALLAELNLVRRTPEGAMVTDYRKAKREKIDPIAMALQELEKQENILIEVHQFVKDFREQKITIKEFLKGPQCLLQNQQEDLEDFMEAYLQELFGIDLEVVYWD